MENKFCVICQEFIVDENVIKTRCEHEFHSHCYDEYLNRSKKNECPICRNSLNEKIDEKTINEIPSNIIHEVIHSDFSNRRLTIHLPTNGFISPLTHVEIPIDFFVHLHASNNQTIDLTEIQEIESQLEDLESIRKREMELRHKEMKKYNPTKYKLFKKKNKIKV